MSGVERIAAERERQREMWAGEDEEGSYTADEHDVLHVHGELAHAAAVYALPAAFREKRVWDQTISTLLWPPAWVFKPSPENRIRELEKAGALIAAEIDRLERTPARDST